MTFGFSGRLAKQQVIVSKLIKNIYFILVDHLVCYGHYAGVVEYNVQEEFFYLFKFFNADVSEGHIHVLTTV